MDSFNVKWMLRSAERLLRLVELDAPGFIIEREKRIVQKRLAELPVYCEDFDKLIAELEPELVSADQLTQQNHSSSEQLVEPFVVKHYAGDERPMIKGNGFDGLEIGEDREEAERFVTWVNERLRLTDQNRDALP